jgi:polyphosphate glucokinase
MGKQTLAVDIGGSGVKVMLLDEVGNSLSDRDRLPTPQPPLPEVILDAVASLAENKEYDRISVGFPGVVRQGITETAANLTPEWIGFDLATALTKRLEKPTRVINDADMQGLGSVVGKGVELVITLGTGVGSALFLNGNLVPNLELGHHPFRKGETYEEQLSREAMDRHGKKRWNERLEKAIALLQRVYNYDILYLGGGNAKLITLPLPANVQTVHNIAGLLGGIALWKS